MKKLMKVVALCSVVSLMTVGCQKEEYDVANPGTSASASRVVCTIQYYIDGIQHRKVISNENEMQVFMEWLFSLAREGRSIMYFDADKVGQCPFVVGKDVKTYHTADSQKAKEWCDRMKEAGYEVQIEFNERTGEFECTATR